MIRQQSLEETVEQAAIIPQEQTPARWGTGNGIGWLAEYERMAQLVSKAVTLPNTLKNSPQTILAVALTGRELGIGFMQSTRVLDVIQGVVTLRSEAKLALANQAGHKIVAVERAPGKVVVKCDAHDSAQVTWDMEKAARAGLDKKENWSKHPEQMLWARAVGQLIREHCPEVCGGLYSKEEVEE